ncbi:hypothetical protein SAMN05444722_2693 [Rhodovulum sp. ES.010]|uniref:aminoglycoside phosphotransferase family protein n=1 Tax=Rhodovulum sp. ES.010 TaxID=1882821 RepID=UPI000929858E|nr:phosphotransferase [Rhodovulum sp. ES.010]SIO49574.1 hypothetical protein SAMN05444722_2693 [Rhodovulum sp. ES.010]
MPDRSAEKAAFLARAGWQDAARAPLAGDASNRRYERLRGGPEGTGAVLMDAPPDTGEDVRPFVGIARHLAGLGLSAPGILAEDTARGFLLIEDLGDALFARVVAADPACEEDLYAAAVDLLVDLHRAAPPARLDPYDAATMAPLAGLAFDWYARALDAPVKDAEATRLLAAFQHRLEEVVPSVLILRDYHAENLIWLPERTGTARVGLLDFQDARIGHPAYDLVSLLEDARRDVPEPLQTRIKARYVQASGADPAAFDRAYALLGAQRNLRILGVFARLCLRDGKPGYLPLLPRVWGHLMRDLAHPALADIRDSCLALLPPPDPAQFDRIARRCHPTP